jgi:hypothetical protein
LWNDFPEKLAAATGAYVRPPARGYGKSSPVSLPRPLYMHDEARNPPKLPDAIGFRRGC